MAAPVNIFLLERDSLGNDRKVRAQTRVVGANTVTERHVIPVRASELLGVYRFAHPTQLTVTQAAHNGTSVAAVWAHVPLSVTGKKVRVRRVYGDSQHSTVLATPTAPRLSLARFTFTGTASGTQVTPDKLDQDYPTPVFDFRTVVTGLTVTLVTFIGHAALAGALTAVGAYTPSRFDLLDGIDEDEWPVLTAGQGVVVYQTTAGEASDTRKYNLQMAFDEIDIS